MEGRCLHEATGRARGAAFHSLEQLLSYAISIYSPSDHAIGTITDSSMKRLDTRRRIL